MTKRILSAFLLMLGLFSCQDVDNQRKQIKTEKLTGTKIKADDFVGKWILGVVQDSIALVTSPGGESLVEMYILKNEETIFSQKILNRGGGPKELLAPFYATSPTFLSFCDFTQNGKMLHIRKDAINDFNIDKLENSKLPIIGMYPTTYLNGYLWLDDERVMYIGGETGEANILTVVDVAKQQSIPTGMWFEDDYKGDNIIKQGAYGINASIYQHPSKSIYVYACRFGQYVETFTLNSEYQVENRKIILDKKPIYEAYPDGLNSKIKDSDRHNPQGVKNVFPTEKYLYVMLENPFYNENGNLTSYKGYSSFHNDMIQVFDWEGNHIKNIELELPSQLLAWDAKNKKLYAVTEGEELDTLMRYELE
ncbi:BF3164 family lipoprotein [Capnocytophaga canis]|uniref:BF3164 family lipoprotein n=1 Tax=Capnocytophaga canis TaxID=1848903 RepID=UPI0037D23E22